MQLLLKRIQWVEFHEHPISHPKQVKVELFEIYSKNLDLSKKPHQNFDHHLYCKLLLEKILHLNSVLIIRFLDFQCKILNRPYSWLNSLDMLLEFNVDFLIESGLGKQLNNALNLVNDKRAEYQQVPRFYREDDFGNDNPYRFESVKSQIDKLETYHAKKAFLLRMKTDYLQNKYNYDADDGVDFDEQIDLELDYLKKLEALGEETQLAPSNIIWNGQINQLVDIFFQCLQIKTSKGLPLMEASNEDLVNVIKNTFCRKDGNRFSASTIRTILKPTRYDKRPKGHKRIDVERFIKSPPEDEKESP